ncbi:MAG: ADP-ribosylglycohydrolase family protein [Verrucomicrobiota bacterium]
MGSPLTNAFLGSLIADAVAMPVHWYYDVAALDRDYGRLEGYLEPRNPHPDSILWRSRYVAPNPKGEILHDQASFWGQRNVHYHQFLVAGENTVNFKLARELYRQTTEAGSYDADAWLATYISLMRTPGWHRDTYLEEYHRAFFALLARGKKPRQCGIDDLHIGGLATVPALVAALDAVGQDVENSMISTMRTHVRLTHQNDRVADAASALTRMLLGIQAGEEVRQVIAEHGGAWLKQAEKMSLMDDRALVGARYTRACYLPGSFSAALALAWKYADDFSGGVLANAACGGDSCHRGAVVGSLLGAALPIASHWVEGLKVDPQVVLN